MVRKLSVLLASATFLALLTCPAASIASTEYFVYRPDISVRFNLDPVFRSVQRFQGVTYKAEYIRDEVVCNSPDIEIRLGQSNMWLSSKMNLKNGNGLARLHAAFSPTGIVTDCPLNLAIVSDCQSNFNVTSLWDPIPIGAKCRYTASSNLIPLIFMGTEELSNGEPLPPILNARNEFSITLKDTADYEVEFGQFVAGKWVPSEQRHQKRVRVSSDVFASFGEVSGRSGSTTSWQSPHVLVSNLFIGEVGYSKHEDRVEAEFKYSHPEQFDIGRVLAQISISKSLFFKEFTDGRKSGIFGTLLPLRVRSKNPDLPFDVVVSAISAEFGSHPDHDDDLVVVGLQVVATSDMALISGASAYMAFTLPELRDNVLSFSLVSAKIQMDTEHFGVPICLDAAITDNLSKVQHEIGTLQSSLDISLPDCIAVDDDKMQPWRRCNSRSVRTGLSRHGPQDNTEILIKPEESEFFIVNKRELLIEIPYIESLYRH